MGGTGLVGTGTRWESERLEYNVSAGPTHANNLVPKNMYQTMLHTDQVGHWFIGEILDDFNPLPILVLATWHHIA